jgi:5-oxopent-3-ene-1,2,5-tricarboxylate decarboxylase/2-hydroxyhepta-2,4-diene-1,7-dioate isomerase
LQEHKHEARSHCLQRRRSSGHRGQGRVCLADGRIVAEGAFQWLPPVAGHRVRPGPQLRRPRQGAGLQGPETPLVFLKGPNTITGHKAHTRRPADATYMHYECELAVVIGKTGKNVTKADAMDRRRLHRGQRLRHPRLPGKLLPAQPAREEPRRLHAAGPWLVDPRRVADPMQLALTTRVNGETTQQGTTADMIFDIPTLIEYLSSFMTLNRAT